MKREQMFGMRFMPEVTTEIAYKQALHDLSRKAGPTPYTTEEREYLACQCLNKARSVLLGSILDQLGDSSG